MCRVYLTSAKQKIKLLKYFKVCLITIWENFVSLLVASDTISNIRFHTFSTSWKVSSAHVHLRNNLSWFSFTRNSAYCGSKLNNHCFCCVCTDHGTVPSWTKIKWNYINLVKHCSLFWESISYWHWNVSCSLFIYQQKKKTEQN